MSQFQRKPILEGILAAAQADATLLAFCPASRMKILRRPIDSIPDWILHGNTGILIKMGTSVIEEEGTCSDVWLVEVDIAAVSMRAAYPRLKNQDAVFDIDDDLRRVFVDDTTIYSESDVWIETARAVEIPPVAQVWSELYSDPDAAIGDMAAIRMEYIVRQQRS